MNAHQPIFKLRDVEFTYAGAPHAAVANVDLSVMPGTLHAVLGPNGSGKSTLLKLLLGILLPCAGHVHFADRPISSWHRRQLARRIGVVTQNEELGFPISTRELVAMGRYPHLGPWQRERELDRNAIDNAMRRCEVFDLAHREFATLSGGEKQRTRIARALAQTPDTLVLDEPTAALDIRHEMQIFELLATLCVRDCVTVVIVTHNLNLAARYAHRLLLLDEGRIAASGPPAAVLDRNTVHAVYNWPVTILPHPGPGPDTGAPQVVPLAGPHTGNSTPERIER